MNFINDYLNKVQAAANPFDLCVSYLITLSVIAVFVAIFIDFKQYNQRKSANSKRSLVATGTMVGFYAIYYIVLMLRLGALQSCFWCKIIGTIMIVSGAVINILGRKQLGRNWANHIKIYDNHTLITKGVYSIARHPLYSSIMLMLFGGSVAYANWLCAVLTAVVFIPMMNYRAKQEEEMLMGKFPEYKEYMKKVRRFL